MNIELVLCAILSTAASCDGARILGILPTPSYSHQVAFQMIWKELSLRGHQVTVLTTDPMKDPTLTNLTEIDLHFTYEALSKRHDLTEIIDLDRVNKLEFFRRLRNGLSKISEHQLTHPEVQKLINNKNGSFDLVMAEFLHPAMYAFSELYQCPLIAIASLEPDIIFYHHMGGTAHPVLHPGIGLAFVTPLNFKERVISTLYTIIVKLFVDYSVIPETTKTVRRLFGEHFPPMERIRDRISLAFVNTNPVLTAVRPLVPSIIEIGGGTHIKAAKALPKDLQTFLDKGVEGAIYFSLGTNVKSGNIRNHTLDIILKTFAEIPYKVLWKFDSINLAKKSDNVLISTWLPQQDVLNHPNVKLFITQGGWQSIEESIYSHTPIVGLPFFADQGTNIGKMVAKGVALSLDHKSMTKEEFKDTILEVMENPKYRTAVKKLAEIARDQPMTGLEKAIWWTEYVLRHKGALHLKSPATQLPPYQFFLLDVIGFCLLVLLIVSFLLLKLLKLVLRLTKYLGTVSKEKEE